MKTITLSSCQKFNVVAKQSLERIMPHEADVFTTVAHYFTETEHLLEKKVDIVTLMVF
ncbi:MAG: hypothetical protein R2744_10900 [Bacteroidales bacterium]